MEERFEGWHRSDPRLPLRNLPAEPASNEWSARSAFQIKKPINWFWLMEPTTKTMHIYSSWRPKRWTNLGEFMEGMEQTTATQRVKCPNLFKGDQADFNSGLFNNIISKISQQQELEGVSANATRRWWCGRGRGRTMLSRAKWTLYYQWTPSNWV